MDIYNSANVVYQQAEGGHYNKIKNRFGNKEYEISSENVNRDFDEMERVLILDNNMNTISMNFDPAAKPVVEERPLFGE